MKAHWIRCLFVVGTTLLGTRQVRADDFRLNYQGATPIALHATLTYAGKGERLVATALE